MTYFINIFKKRYQKMMRIQRWKNQIKILFLEKIITKKNLKIDFFMPFQKSEFRKKYKFFDFVVCLRW